MTKTILGLLAISLLSCNTTKKEEVPANTYNDLSIAGAMKNVMWKGELDGVINLDTIANKKGLYGLGPLSYLEGELLINDGTIYVSKVLSDSTMRVFEHTDVSAPFFVYTNVSSWDEIDLPQTIKSISDLEKFIDLKTAVFKRPFAFKLTGNVSEAVIHIQNLPKGTKVKSPEDAHQGQVRYRLKNADSEIIGFFSTTHKGVFTHHDSFMHMHLITNDKTEMGHLDQLVPGTMKLFLPIN
jgi:acetolactate decarboxylase